MDASRVRSVQFVVLVLGLLLVVVVGSALDPWGGQRVDVPAPVAALIGATIARLLVRRAR